MQAGWVTVNTCTAVCRLVVVARGVHSFLAYKTSRCNFGSSVDVLATVTLQADVLWSAVSCKHASCMCRWLETKVEGRSGGASGTFDLQA